MPQKASKKISTDHPAVEQYYSLLKDFHNQRVKHEGAVSTAFENLLTHLAKQRGWIFIPLLSLKTGKRLVPDGTIRDANGLPRGYWEAKDTDDDLDEEIEKKQAKADAGNHPEPPEPAPPDTRSHLRSNSTSFFGAACTALGRCPLGAGEDSHHQTLVSGQGRANQEP